MIYRNRVNVGTTINTLPYVVAPLPALVNSFSAGAATGLTPNTATTGNVVLGGTLATTNGGTGVVSPTAGSVLVGNGASAVSLVAASTSGNVLTSNGTTWTSAAKPAMQRQLFLTAGASTFTVPAGVTQLKVTVVGGGGTFGTFLGGCAGGASIRWITGLVPAAVIATTVGAGGGATGGSSSFAAYCSATGGSSSGVGGLGSGGDINMQGNSGAGADSGYSCTSLQLVGAGSIFGGGASANSVPTFGGGGGSNSGSGASVAGASGIIVVEWIG